MGILACTFCRSRKIACDRKQPSCSRCLFTGKPCEYRARKSAKLAVHSRIKAFESRLGTLESQLLQEQILKHSVSARCSPGEETLSRKTETDGSIEGEFSHFNISETEDATENLIPPGVQGPQSLPDTQWQQKLYHVYFQQLDPVAPLIHKTKFLKALEGDPNFSPPVALRYAMWAVAALASTEHQHVAENFYITARKEAEQFEMKSTMAQMAPSLAQCWFLLASFEASRAYFTRAWMSVGRCVRAVQMMNLHRLDSPHAEVHALKHGSLIDREEGRRVFWGAYCADKWASTMSGHPLIIKDEDICTNLPSSENSFELGIEEVGVSFLKLDNIERFCSLSSFAGAISATSILGKCLNHLRAYEHGLTAENTGRYWDNHRRIDTSISLIFMNLPTHLRVKKVEKDVNVVFTHFNLHLSIILLHQLAGKTATKQRMDEAVGHNSFQRCLTSAIEIKDTMYSVRDLKNFPVNMWTTAPLYIAAGVFIEDLMGHRPSPNSPADLGLLLIALKEIAELQKGMTFFAQRLEKDIIKAKVAGCIPSHLRMMAGLKVVDLKDGRSAPRGLPYCISDEKLYDYRMWTGLCESSNGGGIAFKEENTK
ncbi:fungal-specific transcription factor domain-containing protein [Cadophora sp. MPI-SDFR-AT-0126]|nr:fungal-specific transcription factor domain-containing protein [Leotiomycetes sp. MPI-SDFR-AT-0126]